jgi:peptidoglycan/LPS O-acetylase OafA/YrhL
VVVSGANGGSVSDLIWLQSRQNNLNLLRMIAATAVVISHSIALTGSREVDLLARSVGMGYGEFGVNIFFFISGFLITGSWIRKNSLLTFTWARVLRICPALWVSTLTFVLVCGLFFSSLGFADFLALPTTISYVIKNLTMFPGFGAQLTLPSAIGAWSGEFNVPLWTLPHELQMYALLALLGVLGFASSLGVTLGVTLVALLAWALGDSGYLAVQPDRYRLMCHFFLGATVVNSAIQIRWASMRLLPIGIGACLICAMAPASLGKYLTVVPLGALVLWFAFQCRTIRFFNRIGDYSYGTYIYGYPVQVAIFYYFGSSLSLWSHLVTSLACILVLACASWHLLERRALRIPLPLQAEKAYESLRLCLSGKHDKGNY